MPFVIIDREGNPLADIDGKPIFVATRREAQACLKPGEMIVRTSLPRWQDDPPEPGMTQPQVKQALPAPGAHWSERTGKG